MNAMILAAGLGTRLRPLTEKTPKALVKVEGIPLLEIALLKLKAAGIRNVVINIHHLGELIMKFLDRKNNFGMNINISDERDHLLDTGGALKKAIPHFKEGPILVMNVDVLSDLNLSEFILFHKKHQAIATLAVRKRNTSRYLLFDDSFQLCGWTNVNTGEIKYAQEKETLEPFAFSGIHIISPELFQFFPQQPIFSIIDTYLMAARKEKIIGFNHSEGIWLDVGKPSSLKKASSVLEKIHQKRKAK